MKNVKFRAWEIDWYNTDLKQNQGRMLQWEDIRDDFAQIQDKTSHFILMQFTGLKDMTGKDIYEGDIIEARFGSHYFTRTGWKESPDIVAKVFWDYSSFRLVAVNKEDERYADFSDFEQTSEDFFLMETTESKVIGNIYENPDLIKTKHE